MQVTLKWRASWLVMTGLEKKTDGFSNDFNRKKKYTMFFLSLVIGFSVHQS
jgi:hypothetical protein